MFFQKLFNLFIKILYEILTDVLPDSLSQTRFLTIDATTNINEKKNAITKACDSYRIVLNLKFFGCYL